MDPRVQAAMGGDRAAVQSLLRELLPRIRNLSRAILGADRDVDDVAQQAMEDVLKGLTGFRGEGSFKRWCDRITVRAAIAHARKSRVHNVQLLDGVDGDDLEAPDAPNDVGYATRRAAMLLLDALPVEQRSAIVLHHVVGLSVPELAEHENVSQETVRSRLRLAMVKLRSRAELRSGARMGRMTS